MREFFSSRGVRITAVLLTLFITMLIISFIWDVESLSPGNPLRSVFSPFSRLITLGVEQCKNAYAYINDFDNIKAENEELKAQISDMEEEIRAARNANSENIALREALGLMQTQPEWELVAQAPLVAWSSSSWTSAFTIGGGSVAGISRGDTVITTSNYLVGQVIEVGTTTALVRTLIDVDFNVGAYDDRNGISGVASGEYDLMWRGVLKLGMLPARAEAPLDGLVILPSGAGEVFPRGLVIGHIVAYKIDKSGMDWYGEIAPAAELDSISNVLVIR